MPWRLIVLHSSLQRGVLERVFKLRTQLLHFFWRTEKTYDLAQQRKDELAPCLVSSRDTCETAHLVISFWTWTPSATSTKLEDVFSPHLGLYRATVLRSQRKGAHRGAYELQLVAQLYVGKGALLLLKISTPPSLQKCRLHVSLRHSCGSVSPDDMSIKPYDFSARRHSWQNDSQVQAAFLTSPEVLWPSCFGGYPDMPYPSKYKSFHRQPQSIPVCVPEHIHQDRERVGG